MYASPLTKMWPIFQFIFSRMQCMSGYDSQNDLSTHEWTIKVIRECLHHFEHDSLTFSADCTYDHCYWTTAAIKKFKHLSWNMHQRIFLNGNMTSTYFQKISRCWYCWFEKTSFTVLGCNRTYNVIYISNHSCMKLNGINSTWLYKSTIILARQLFLR